MPPSLSSRNTTRPSAYLVRDDRAALEHYLASPDSPIWIAQVGAAPAGCVMLRPLPEIPHAAEVKRLYVRPAFRGLAPRPRPHAGRRRHARRAGVHWLYLDTKDDLHAAIRFYRRHRIPALSPLQ